jgi:flagellar biosynthesis protein FlhG
MPSLSSSLDMPPVQVIAVTGGKGGVGKTSVAVNLASALAQRERRVLLLDGDLGLANVDVLLGITARQTLAHVLAGQCTLEEAITATPYGFSIIPAASGIAALAQLGTLENAGLVRAFGDIAQRIDCMVIDTAAGIGNTVLTLSQAAQNVIVVVCDEPASITDAYALIKVLSREHEVTKFRVLANQVRYRGDGEILFRKLASVAERFLDVTLDYVGEVPDDSFVKASIREQRPVVTHYPSSPAALALKNLAARADTWGVAEGPRGNVEFFVERLLRRPPVRLEVVR